MFCASWATVECATLLSLGGTCMDGVLNATKTPELVEQGQKKRPP